jgi:hypothetical protein
MSARVLFDSFLQHLFSMFENLNRMAITQEYFAGFLGGDGVGDLKEGW